MEKPLNIEVVNNDLDLFFSSITLCLILFPNYDHQLVKFQDSRPILIACLK